MKDFLGRNIIEGDIVARAIHSEHTFHKVIKITQKGITLSRGNRVREYERTNYHRNPTTGRYEPDGTTSIHQWTTVGGANSIQEVEQHDRSIYLKKDNVSLVLV